MIVSDVLNYNQNQDYKNRKCFLVEARETKSFAFAL